MKDEGKTGQIKVRIITLMQTHTREGERERRERARARPGGHATWASRDQWAEAPKFLSEDKVRHTADTEIKVSARTATTQIFARSLIC